MFRGGAKFGREPMDELNPLLSAALTARRHGVSIVPVELPAKTPPYGFLWKDRETKLPNERTIRQDLEGGNGSTGFAIIGGKVSGNLETLDFDLQGAAYPEWVSLVEAEAPGLINRLSIQQTMSGGYHAIARCVETKIPGSQKLARKRVEVSGPGEHEYQGKKYTAKQHGGQWFLHPTLIETKGEGGYAVAAPSPGYAVIQTPQSGEFFDFPGITAAEREILHRCAKALDEKFPETIIDGPQQKTANANDLRPGDDFNRRGNVLETLLRNDWKLAGGNSERQQLTRPGKEKGISATLYDGRTLHVFSSNAEPFEMDASYSAFAVFASIEHGGDYSKAAGELARQGYGGNEKNEIARTSAPLETTKAEVCEPPALALPKQDPAAFPLNVLSGLAGDFAALYSQHLEPPIQFFYMSFLACLGWLVSNRISLDSEIKTPARLFTLLLGESADDRKSTAIDKTIDFFSGIAEGFAVCRGVGSAEGLQKLVLDKPHLLLCFDEFKHFVSKCRIEASVLLPMVNTLFESQRFETHTKTVKISVENACLSLLAASTTATYQQTWSQAFTDIGFNNRLFLVIGQGSRKFAFPRPIPDDEKYTLKNELRNILEFVGTGRSIRITPEAEKFFQGWYLRRESSVHAKRLDGYALRLMQLLAVNEQKEIIDLVTVQKVVSLCDWQLTVRKLNDPIGVDNVVARLENNIRRQLEVRTELTEAGLRKWVHAETHGLYPFQCALQNMEKAGIVERFKRGQKAVFRLAAVDCEDE
jgi:hypothetical protein